MNELNNINCRNSRSVHILKKNHDSQREGKSESIPSNEINLSLSLLPPLVVLVRVLQRNRTNRIYIDIYNRRFINRNWLTWLWRRRSSWSAICKLQNQEIQSYNSIWVKRAENGGLTHHQVWVQKPENQEHKCLRTGENECFSSSRENEFALPLLFCFIQTLNKLDGAHPHWQGPSALLSSWI